MRRFTLACMMLVLVGSVQAQSKRNRVYPPYFNGYGQMPGLSVYDNGTYSRDYFGGSTHYNYGYRPPQRHSYRRYNGGNGLIYNPSMYYDGMYLSPYNVNSPIWW